MKYLKNFETQDDNASWAKSNEYAKPNVVLVEENGNIIYDVPRYGVSIQHINGTLYYLDEWKDKAFTPEDANGVAIVTDKVACVIAKDNITSSKWDSSPSLIDGIISTTVESDAKNDYDGFKNTKIISKYIGTDAANNCLNFTFPNGQKGYLPSLGELYLANRYSNSSDKKHVCQTNVNNALKEIGGAPFDYSDYWSSTQYSTNYAWTLYGYQASVNDSYKTTAYKIRPFTLL